MQPNDVFELEKAVAQLKADITILENTVQNLKDSDDRFEITLSKASDDIIALKLSINDRFNSMNNDILSVKQKVETSSFQIEELTKDFQEMKSSVQKVSNNSLLEMTSDLGAKQLIAIFLLLASFVTTPGLLADYFNSDDKTDTKIDTLIELLENGA